MITISFWFFLLWVNVTIFILLYKWVGQSQINQIKTPVQSIESLPAYQKAQIVCYPSTPYDISYVDGSLTNISSLICN